MYSNRDSVQAETESSPALNASFGEATQPHLIDLRDLLAVQQMDERGARWVCWKAETDGGKLDKIPVRPNGINADVTRKAHCAPLEACLEAVRRDPSIAGIGYVIAAPRDLEAGLEPIVGIDLDSCRNPETGEIDAWAHEIINAFSSYAEVSPSGTGVKILALVDPSTRLIGGKRVIQVAAGTEHPKQVEVYVDGRFFTITGQILEWVPDELTNATAAYERLATTLTPFKTKNETRAENFASDGEEPSAETIATILGNRKAKEIWEGRKVTGDCTASGYDASLAAILGVLGVPDEEIARALCHFEHGQIGNGTLRKRGEVERQLGRLLKIANKARGEKDDYVAHGEWVWGRIQAGLQARKEAKAAGAEQGDRLRAAGVLARDMPQEAPQDPQEGRFEGEPDFDASEGVEAPDEPVAAPAGEPWPEPIDTFSEHFPSTIKVDETNMPTALLKLGRGEGARLGVDPAGICALALGACSGVISDDWHIRLKNKDNWAEAPRLWMAIVSAPGSKKTDQMRIARGPVDAIEEELRKKYQKDFEAYENELEEWQGEKPGERGPKPKPPPHLRVTFQDATIESLSDTLSTPGNDKLLLAQDELTVLFGSFDRYSSGKGGAARGHWLRLKDGGPNAVDRVRGKVFCPNWSASVIGGIQPEKLRKLMADLTDDGMLQRFAVVYPTLRPTGDPEDDDKAPDYAALTSYDSLIRYLWKLKPPQRDGGGILQVRAGDGVQEERRRMFRLIERIEADPELPLPLKETVSKWRGLLSGISLTFHLIRFASKETPCAVTVEASTVRMAANFIMHVVAPSVFRLFKEAGLEGNEAVRSVAGWILAHGETCMSARDVGRAERKLLAGKEKEIVATMTVLEHLCWVRGDGHPRRPKWTVNPRVHELFAARAQAERERRQRDQELIRRKLASFTA